MVIKLLLTILVNISIILISLGSSFSAEKSERFNYYDILILIGVVNINIIVTNLLGEL